MAAAKGDDWPMELWIQEGVRHSGADTFLIGENEQPIQHFHRTLRRHV